MKTRLKIFLTALCLASAPVLANSGPRPDSISRKPHGHTLSG